MAASKVGAIWLGLSPKFTVDELRYVLGHAQPTALITLREYMGVDLVQSGLTFREEFLSINEVLLIGEPHEELQDFLAFIQEPRPELDEALAERVASVQPQDETLLMYTSGSTGKPKGVLQTHDAIIKNIEAEVEHLGFDRHGRTLLHFPINHVAADVEIGFAAVFAGATIVFMDHFDPQGSLELVERERITLLGRCR